MKEFFKWFKIGAGIFVFLFLATFLTYITIKARQSTNPWLTDSTPSALYTNSNETLTAAKRNNMADRVLWLNNVRIKVVTWTSISTYGTTALAHWLDRTKILAIDCSYYAHSIFRHRWWSSTVDRGLQFNSTSILLTCSGNADTECLNQPIRCVVFYTN